MQVIKHVHLLHHAVRLTSRNKIFYILFWLYKISLIFVLIIALEIVSVFLSQWTNYLMFI